MKNERENFIVQKSSQLALKIVAFCEELEDKRKFVVSEQLLKSGTLIGVNIREAQDLENKDDFIHKLKIAAKKAEETEYWLRICKNSKIYPFKEELLECTIELKKYIFRIINRSKKNDLNYESLKFINEYSFELPYIFKLANFQIFKMK